MNEENEYPHFVAVTAGKIVAVGENSADVNKYIGQDTVVVNLQGRTMIPGIVDAHSHFGGTATKLAQGFNISPPPFGTITSIPLLLAEITRFITANNIQPGTTIYGQGYSDIDLAEGRHPTRYELDSVSAVNPIVLEHFSGHIVVANSLALSTVNYVSASSSPLEVYWTSSPTEPLLE